METRSVGILLFDDVEVLDFAGPFEVLSITSFKDRDDVKPFKVETVSETGKSISARNRLQVVPDYSFDTAPPFDILVVPGGSGARLTELHNDRLIDWIKEQDKTTEMTTSVCTGALLLAQAGLLDGKRATTHWASYDLFADLFPNVEVVREVKFVDEGRIVTSGGISAGIVMAFHLVEVLVGLEEKWNAAKRMEYDLPERK
ncbi:DJ-1/PfpI family protein [Niallia circulans]|uniref:DJ-1/PfpI family protein n=1 Tax=Niallia circulans TaxID=1397 RepID=A0A553SM16_NIACI|nr:DJ-1/PfpI family protein [Niallia circulans]TRZ38022.1 DJ-1/PfpI family protein [Niallia circulans]